MQNRQVLIFSDLAIFDVGVLAQQIGKMNEILMNQICS